MTLFKRLFAPLAAFLAFASPAVARVPVAARVPAQARPALWEVSNADTNIYLFGTIHLLPTNYQWRTAKFNQALASSNELVVETIVDLQHPDEILTAKRDLGYSAGLPPIEKREGFRTCTAGRAVIWEYSDETQHGAATAAASIALRKNRITSLQAVLLASNGTGDAKVSRFVIW